MQNFNNMKNILTTLCLAISLCGSSAKAQTQTLRVWADNMTMTADGETVTRLTVYETDVVNYSAFNMAFVLPKGVKVAQVKKGRVYVDDVTLNADRFDGLDHSITVNMPDETTLKVMCYSGTITEIYPDDAEGNPVEELFSIGLVADPATLNGTYSVNIVDCAFTPAEGKASEPQDNPTFTMTVTGGTDGVNIPYRLNDSGDGTGIGTLILPFTASVPEGLAAQRCTDVVNSIVITENVDEIEAGVPLLITGTPGSYSFVGVPEKDETLIYDEGIMSGVLTETVIDEGFVLQKQDDIVAFYGINSERPITIPAYRCWLNLSSDAAFIRIGGATTAIANVTKAQKSSGLYDLSGRKRKEATQVGVYIENGKKVLVY